VCFRRAADEQVIFAGDHSIQVVASVQAEPDQSGPEAAGGNACM
jgi:hypothetical protein